MNSLLHVVIAPNPSPMTLDGTRTYIIHAGGTVVVDPGPDIPSHVDAVADAAGEVGVIVVTHHHADHGGGAEALAAMTGAPILRGRSPSGSGDRMVGDRAALPAGFEALHTPGHSPDHICVAWNGPGAPAGGAIFVGDLLLGEGDTTLVAAPEGNIAEYLKSLDTIRERRPAILYPAHGPPIADPDAAIRRYRAHRLQRIDQVREILEDRPDLPSEKIVEEIYGGDLPEELEAAASASVAAVRSHLRREGLRGS